MELSTLELDAVYGKGRWEVYSDAMTGVVFDTYKDKVIKKFKGETAHMDADRFASDLFSAEQYA